MIKLKGLTDLRNLSLLTIFLMVANCIPINAAPTTDIGNNGNVAPTIDLNVTPIKKPVDIVILTDYTGTKLTALNTQINALKAQFNAVNVDPVFHIIKDVKKVGVQNDKLHMFRRYGRYHAKISYYSENDEDTDKNRWFEETEEWEEIEGLKSQRASLPVRNPQNVTFTRSSLQERYTDRSYKSWYDITISCTNDVKTSGTVSMEMTYDNWYSGTYRDKQSIIGEYAEVDSSWTMEEKVADVTFDIYSLDFDKLNAIQLRTGSDRHMIFISDATVKDYSKPLGSYFNFGDMTDAVKNYIKDNNFSLYGVTPNDTRYMTLLSDKVLNILPLGTTALFYMIDGGIQKFGKYGLEETEDIGVVKDKVFNSVTTSVDNRRVILNVAYLLMEDGTVKWYDSITHKFITIEGITNATKIYSLDGVRVLDSNGKMYEIDNYGIATVYNTSVLIKGIVRYMNENIYINVNGIPYVETKRVDKVADVTTYSLARLRIWAEDGTTRYMPAIKDAESFYAAAPRFSLRPVLFLYTTGKIQQFPSSKYLSTYSGTNDRYKTTIFYIVEDTAHSIMETNVDSIESSKVSIFIYKKDGTVKMLNTDWVETSFRDDDEGTIIYQRPYLKNLTETVPLNNIKKTYTTEHDLYFLTDENNRTYMYYGTAQALPPVIGTTLTDMGDVKKISHGGISTGSYIYILYNNDTVKQFRYYSYHTETVYKTMLPYTNIKDVFASSVDVYLLDYDGNVLRKSNEPNFIDPFASSLTFDTTKTYLSLLDIFNQAVSGVFYPAGKYTTAFNDIYKRYSDYSSSGNMYVLLGDDIKYESVYDDYESDPEYSRKWHISHDPIYYDNSMGLSQYNNPTGFTTNPPIKLDKVGKYIINLKARDNPKSNVRFLNDTNEEYNYYKWSLGDQNLTVYIHRKPIALQRIIIANNGNGTFTVKALDAGSYDSDHSNSMTDKGIVAREWRWRESTSTVWTTGQMNKSDCTADKSYITQLRVKDFEGVWSDYDTITIDRHNPPEALFSLEKSVISTGEYLKVKDQSFPQSISEITNWHWVVKKINADGSVPLTNIQNAKFTDSNTGTDDLVGYDKNVKFNYTSVGKYRAYLRVKDSNGLWSDGGNDSLAFATADLENYYSMDFEVDSLPMANFNIEKNPIFIEENLKLKDQSISTGISSLSKWHWIVKKLNADGSIPGTNIQDAQFTRSNNGIGEMTGYDVNVKTQYADKGPGTYRIYLRVMNGNGMWSDGGTEDTYNLGDFFYKDLIVQESFKMSNFRVVKIRDLHLEPYYNVNSQYPDKPFYVNSMAIDPRSFELGGISIVPGFTGLAKGYRFEFEIDTTNFNEANDTIVITPTFYSYTSGVPGVRGPKSALYWEDSNKVIYQAGEGEHSRWGTITLNAGNRIITGDNEATWRGEYFIPATSWLVPLGTTLSNADSSRMNADIIVNFEIKGYRSGELKYNYNIQQWPVERSLEKHPYEIGDVIMYSNDKNNLEDTSIIINRP